MLIQIIAGPIQLEGGGMKNFDQWTEELSKEIFVHSEDDQVKILSRLDEMADEDYEEE